MRQDTNADRVKRARKMLRAYADLDHNAELQSYNITDILADLMHFCDTMSHRPGWYFADLLAMAEEHHDAERTKE
jgi:hypothetical protein